jgi:hypothetical protein
VEEHVVCADPALSRWALAFGAAFGLPQGRRADAVCVCVCVVRGRGGGKGKGPAKTNPGEWV